MDAKQILIVDDDAITRYLIQGFLKGQSNYNVQAVESGRHCLDYLEHNDVDLIISDVEMDNIDGLQLSKNLLEKKDTSNIPVILSSIRDRAEIAKQSKCYSNVKKVVQKPYDRNELLSDLKENLDL